VAFEIPIFCQIFCAFFLLVGTLTSVFKDNI
jgi:hypothetical protein